jgi:LDH2 family malate/lactate/ureidoglycolate dehydrogenase
MPGESTALNTQKRLVSGIAVHPVIWERMEEVAAAFEVELPKAKA